MSITVTTDVFCDLCGGWVTGTTGPKARVREARRVARKAGWICNPSGDGDMCPDCKEDNEWN